MLESIISQYETKKQFCDAVGIKPQYLTQIEKGEKPVPPKACMAIYRLHGVHPSKYRPEIYPADLTI